MSNEQVQLENTFGRIAIAHGMATAAQVEEAIRATRKLAELGLEEKLGAVMVKKGYLTRERVEQILQIQGRRAANRIEGYEMISKLGQGAMGAVYKARQVSLDRLVALKILSPRLAKDKSYVKRFLSEARSVAKLNHPNIIQGIDVGASRGNYYFAMEFVDGVTLADILRDKGPMDETHALQVMEDIGEALDHANRHGLIHRDVKPDNIMVTEVGEAKLCDLGLAKSSEAHGPAASATNVGRVVGTPHYIAPEQARGDDHIDVRADIYSLGATLYHVLTGRTPYTGENPQIVMTKHLTEPLEDPRDVGGDISEGAALLILKMMVKNREDRYQTPAELVDDIRTVLRGRIPPHLNRASAATRRSGRTVAEHRRGRARATSGRRRGSGLTGLLATLGGLVVVGFVVANLFSSRGRGRSGSPRRPAALPAKRSFPAPGPAEDKGPPEERGADDLARGLYEKAVTFAADPQFAQRYPEIFRRFRRAIAAGDGSPYAAKAATAFESYKKRQVDERNKLIARLSEKARALAREDKFRQAYALWEDFPNDLLPESGASALALLDPKQKAVLDAAQRRFDALVKAAYSKAAEGDYRRARGLLRQAGSIGLERVTSRLPSERKRLEQAIAKRRAEARSESAEAWERTRKDILGLAGAGDYEGARIIAQEAVSRGAFQRHADELGALLHDTKRMALRQEFAMEGLQARIRKGRVVVHKNGRGFAGTVVKAEKERITLRPATRGSKPVIVMKQDLTPEDIRKHSPIILSDAEGWYDYAILLVYSGQPKKARAFLKRCLAGGPFADRARRHLERIPE